MKHIFLSILFLTAFIADASVTLTPAASPSVNAALLQGRNIAATAPADTNVLAWDAASSTWKPTAGGGGSGSVTSVDMSVPAFLSVSGNPVTTSGTLAVTYSGTALPIANGGTAATSASAAFNALSPMTTGGDLIYGGASGAGTRLANGTAGQYLASAGTTLAPVWTALPQKTQLSATSGTKTPSATSQFHALTTNTITLTAGTWLVWGSGNFAESGGASYTSWAIGIYGGNGADSGTLPALANTVTGLTINSAVHNQIQTYLTSTVAGAIATPQAIMTCASSCPIYVVTYATMTTPANARITAYINAMKLY